MKKSSVILFFFLLVSCGWMAQNLPPGQYSSTNKKAIKYFEESRTLFNYKKDAEAEKKIQAAIKEDPNFTEAYAAYADFLGYKARYQEAITNYKKAIEIAPRFMVDNNFYLGRAYMAVSDYDNAKLAFQNFVKHERINPNLKDEAQQLIKNCDYASSLVKNPKPFKPVNAGAGINTNFDEYFPAINGDGRVFLFTRDIYNAGNPMDHQEDFYMSRKENNVWQTAQPVPQVNTGGNEGADRKSVV